MFIAINGPNDTDGSDARIGFVLGHQSKLEQLAFKAEGTLAIKTNQAVPMISKITEKKSGQILWDACWVPMFKK